MSKITLDESKCIGCGRCLTDCSSRCFEFADSGAKAEVIAEAEERCIECGHCVSLCPTDAISVGEQTPEKLVSIDELLLPSFGQYAELVKYRRSIRCYQERSVDQEDLNKLFEMLRWVPTAKNLLPVHWYVINDPQRIRKLASTIIGCLRSKGTGALLVTAWDQKGYDWIFRGAPCLIFNSCQEESQWTMSDTAIGIETLDLGASALGLGACWAGMFVKFAATMPELREEIGLAADEQVGAALMLGYPAGAQYVRVPYRPKCNVRYL